MASLRYETPCTKEFFASSLVFEVRFCIYDAVKSTLERLRHIFPIQEILNTATGWTFRTSPIPEGTALVYACQRANDVICERERLEEALEIVRLLLDHGADPNAKASSQSGEDDFIPLHMAVKRGNLALTRVLLEGKAQVDQTDADGRSALHICCIEKYMNKPELEIVQILIQHKVNINLQNNYGQTPLHVSITTYKHDLMAALLENGASTSIQDNWGNSPLHLAFKHSCAETTKKLISCTTDVNIQNKKGQTPLHISCAKKTWDLTMTLFENGALTTIRDNTGEWPLHKVALDNPKLMLPMINLCAMRHNENIKLICETCELAALWIAYPDSFECLRKATVLRIEHNIPKRILEPMECYGFHKEWETIQVLETCRDDKNQLKLQAILAKERIHKGQNEKLVKLIQEDLISVVLTASKSAAGGLLKHHLNIWSRYKPDGDKDAFFDVVLWRAWRNKLKKHFRSFDSMSLAELIHIFIENLPKTIANVVHDLHTITTLIMKLYRRNRQVENTFKNEGMLAKDLLQQLLDTDNGDEQYPIQHLITWYIFSTRKGYYKLFDYELMKMLLESGIKVNAVDCEGNTILHTALSSLMDDPFDKHLEFCNPVSLDQGVRTIELLLEKGVNPNAMNKQCNKARYMLGKVRKPPDRENIKYKISEMLQQYELQNSMTLKHIAAVAVKKSGCSYGNFLPNALVKFVDLYNPRR